MADEANLPPDEGGSENEAESPRKRGRLVQILFSPKWLLTLLAASLVGHVFLFGYVRWTRCANVDDSGLEFSLGDYQFETDLVEPGEVLEAEFSLHIALQEQVEQSARHELVVKQFRVQQAVEELVRQANSRDFNDPLLFQLKHSLQEEINRALGIKVVEEVIITRLEIRRQPESLEEVSETAGDLPWAEEPAG